MKPLKWIGWAALLLGMQTVLAGSDQAQKDLEGMWKPSRVVDDGKVEKEGELVVFADAAAWAARLKLWLGEQDTGARARRVTVRIRQQRHKK